MVIVNVADNQLVMENIVENNKLIAEFMGFKDTFVRNYKGVKYDYDIPDEFELIKEVEISIEGEHGWGLEQQSMCMVEDLIFHKSWDWLMAVVEKIEKDNPGYYVKIYGNQAFVQVHIMGDNTILTSQKYVAGSAYDEKNTKLSNTWNAVVEFIKYYNENKDKISQPKL